MANQFDQIIVSSDPKGVREEATIDGTPKPGTVMTVKSGVEPVAGKFTYEAFNRDADGDRAEIAVLREDELQGKLVTDAYVSGTLGRLYFPVHGDLLQMLVKVIAGTGDTFVISDYMIVEDVTGKLLATTGTPEIEPFVIMETVSVALAADTLVLCRYTGH